MSTLTAKEIREQLIRYLVGDLESATFRNWFALALRDVHKSNDVLAEPLAHAIEWAFSDAERGGSPEGLRSALARLTQIGEAMNPGVPAVVVATFSSTVRCSVTVAGLGTAGNPSPTPYNALSSSRSPLLNEVAVS